MKNLITMTDFVFITGKKYESTHRENLAEIYNYAIFLNLPLELWMFVPCDDDGNVLEMPHPSNYNMQADVAYYLYNDDIQRFMQAKERCLFVWQKGFDYKIICEMFNDLEDIILFEFELTETAQKQLGL